VFDTSGNFADAATVPFGVDRTQATVTLDGIAPTPFTPDGDGDEDVTAVTYTTVEPTWQRVRITTSGGTTIATPLGWTQVAAGSHQVTWDGRRSDGSLADPGSYIARVEVKDLVTPELAPASITGTVTVLATLGAVTAGPTPFSPNGDGTRDLLEVDYVVNSRSDVTVAVTTAGGDPVETLQATLRRSAGSYSVTWDGRAGSGEAADGQYVVLVKATTSAGTDTKRRRVVLDRTAPVTSDDGGGAWHTSDAVLGLTADDSLSAVVDTSYSVDGGAWQSGTSVTVPGPSDGSNDGVHTVEYRSTDEAGNVEAPREAQVRIGHLTTQARYIRHKASLLTISWPEVPGAVAYDVFVDGEAVGSTTATGFIYRVPTEVKAVTLTVVVVARGSDDTTLLLRGAQVPWR
jgi:flagellar hook assembly protein FlgD